jgi:hypothetical protein
MYRKYQGELNKPQDNSDQVSKNIKPKPLPKSSPQLTLKEVKPEPKPLYNFQKVKAQVAQPVANGDMRKCTVCKRDKSQNEFKKAGQHYRKRCINCDVALNKVKKDLKNPYMP